MFYVILILLIGLLVFGYVKHRADAPWGRAVVNVSVGLIAVWSVGAVMFTGGDDIESAHQQVMDRELTYERVAAEKLATHLASSDAGTRAVVIMPADPHPIPGRNDALLEGLRRGFGDKVQIVATVDPPLPAEVANTPLGDELALDELPPRSTWFNASLFDQMIAGHADADIVVSLGGLPVDAAEMRTLQNANRPVVAVLDATSEHVTQLVESGHVAAAVQYKAAGNISGATPPDDLDAAFDNRYKLLTSPGTK